MRTFFITILAGAALSMTACKNQGSSNAGSDSTQTSAQADALRAAVMSFETTSYDFGKIKEGEKVSYSFKFKNTGKSPLIVSDATASCGCTVPEKPDHPVAPGEDGEIKVVFNSTGKQGLQNKAVTITSNAQPATVQLYLTGEVLTKE